MTTDTWKAIKRDSDLPDDDITVLAALSDGEVWPAYHDADGWYYVTADPIESSRVTHWMHMPAHPEAV